MKIDLPILNLHRGFPGELSPGNSSFSIREEVKNSPLVTYIPTTQTGHGLSLKNPLFALLCPRRLEELRRLLLLPSPPPFSPLQCAGAIAGPLGALPVFLAVPLHTICSPEGSYFSQHCHSNSSFLAQRLCFGTFA